MKVLLIIAAVIFLIGCIPVSLGFHYRDRAELTLFLFFVKIPIYPEKPLPRKKREKAAAKKEAKAAAKKTSKAEAARKAKAKALIAKPKPAEPVSDQPQKTALEKLLDLIPWAKLGSGFVGEFFHRKLTVTRLRIRAVLTGRDPAKTSLTVAKAWSMIGVLLPILERAFRIQERRIAVYPDFTARETDFEAELRVRIRIGGVVLLAMKYGFRSGKLYLSRKKQTKQPEAEPAS